MRSEFGQGWKRNTNNQFSNMVNSLSFFEICSQKSCSFCFLSKLNHVCLVFHFREAFRMCHFATVPFFVLCEIYFIKSLFLIMKQRKVWVNLSLHKKRPLCLICLGNQVKLYQAICGQLFGMKRRPWKAETLGHSWSSIRSILSIHFYY